MKLLFYIYIVTHITIKSISWKKIDKIKRKRKASNMGIYLLFLDKNNKPLNFRFCYFFFLFLPSLENKIENEYVILKKPN